MKILLLLCLLFGYSRAIFNGIVAQPGQFPWAVQIYPSACSASIIHTNGWVMSAAHCLDRGVNGQVCRSLINGANNKNDRVNCEYFVAGNVHFHPHWGTTQWVAHNDIVIVRLNRDFTNLPGFGPVAAPLLPVNFAMGEQVTIAGFGEMGVGVPTDVLRWQNFNRVGGSNIGSYYTVQNTFTSLRPGDSGSGLTFVRNNQRIIIAVTCCSAMHLGARGYATSISHQLPWLHRILGITSAPPPPPPPPPPPTEGCERPVNCGVNQSFNRPATDPRRFYNCHAGLVVERSCPPGTAFGAPQNCMSLPIQPSLRFPCQDWSMIGQRDEF